MNGLLQYVFERVCVPAENAKVCAYYFMRNMYCRNRVFGVRG